MLIWLKNKYKHQVVPQHVQVSTLWWARLRIVYTPEVQVPLFCRRVQVLMHKEIKKKKDCCSCPKKKKRKKIVCVFLKQLLLHNTVIFASLTCWNLGWFSSHWGRISSALTQHQCERDEGKMYLLAWWNRFYSATEFGWNHTEHDFTGIKS